MQLKIEHDQGTGRPPLRDVSKDQRNTREIGFLEDVACQLKTGHDMELFQTSELAERLGGPRWAPHHAKLVKPPRHSPQPRILRRQVSHCAASASPATSQSILLFNLQSTLTVSNLRFTSYPASTIETLSMDLPTLAKCPGYNLYISGYESSFPRHCNTRLPPPFGAFF